MSIKHFFNDDAMFQKIYSKYGLGKEHARGSSAIVFSNNDLSIHRLTASDFTHEFLIEASQKTLQVPKLIKDFGFVGGEDYEEFYLGIFEKCEAVPVGRYQLFEDFLAEVYEYIFEEEAVEVAKTSLNKYKDYLIGIGLYDSLNFAIEFADFNNRGLDFQLSNFMLNQSGDIVMTDPIG